jgi:ubiquinone/menaquinone biosynthesis C-methylase UbiE
MTSHPIYTCLGYAVALAFIPYVMWQVRKPGKWFGRIFARAMNRGHSKLIDWGLSHVVIGRQFTTLDIGCGGGATVGKVAAIAADGMAYGIDYAEGSIAVSRRLNSKLIGAGRVVIQKATVSQLPFPDDTFDLATAIETQYYWPDLPADMQEVLRVLKPGGKLVVVAETYKGGKYDWVQWPIMWLLRSSHLSVNDHRELFTSAGYVNVQIFEENSQGWICAMATKPATELRS